MEIREAVTRKELEKVKTLYEATFPENEKKPFSFMLEGRKKGQFNILYIEEECFCGLAIMMLYGNMALLDYFAIDPDLRNSGHGGRALRKLQERFAGKKFLLEIESTQGLKDGEEQPTGISREEAQKRLRRKAFYQRWGMEAMDFRVLLFGVEMELLVYRDRVEFDEYHEILEHVLPPGYGDRVVLV